MKNIFKVFIIAILTFQLCVPMQIVAKASAYTNMDSKKDVAVNKVWTVSFNKPLSATTVNTTNIKVIGQDNNNINIKVSLANSNKNIIVQALNNYEYNKTYTLIVTEQVKSEDGKPLAKEVRMSFTTQAAPTNPTGFIVCINPARGGSDSGNIGPTGLKEKDVNLEVALRLGQLLEKENVQVVYTRSGDSVTWNSDNEIQERVNIANNAKSDLLVTISCNSYTDEATNGIETYYLKGNDKSMQLAEYIQAQLVSVTAALDRGIKESEFNSLKLSNAPGALATLGFITNKNEEAKLKTTEYKDKLALAFKEAVKKYISVNPTPESGGGDTTAKYKVVLDAGHGGFDPGATGPTNLQEKTIALAVTLKVGNILVKNGVQTIYTRTSDNITWSTNQTQNLQARCDVSNNAKPNLFASIHCNSYSVQAASGIETWYYAGGSYSTNSAKLATTVQSELIKETGRVNRGTKTGNLYVTKYVNTPAILVETSFISNPDEEKLLATEAYQNKLAKAISTGILKNLGISNIVY